MVGMFWQSFITASVGFQTSHILRAVPAFVPEPVREALQFKVCKAAVPHAVKRKACLPSNISPDNKKAVQTHLCTAFCRNKTKA